LLGRARVFKMNDINTDYIIAGRYKFKTLDMNELAKHIMEDIRPNFYDEIKKGDFIVVLFWLDRAVRTIMQVHPRGDRTKPKRGVFATRSPVRPNPVAVSELEVQDIQNNILFVKGLDILDSTPVIDIKSKIY